MSERNWPEDGELVVCTVVDVKDFAAFVTLDEYGARPGLIPISEIARGWIKYIRDYIREGQKVVCKVLHVDTSRGHIDLSLKDVNDHQRREKIQEWKNEQKAQKWIGFASEASGVDPARITEILHSEYAMLYPFFEDLVVMGDEITSRFDLPESAVKALVEVAHDNVKVQKVMISGIIDMMSDKPDGVNVIRRALRSAETKLPGVEVEITYLGAPRYQIKVTAPDYKVAEKAIEKVAANTIGVVERAGGTGKLIRKQK
ncbi:MAG: translation initiation factor IF-2 subunit alpha [Methanocalculus sp. MSAO_Arc1]|uniref:translation initiation factor IF-2 subunit alpha n=1 Tax=Methanocalculus TaxID=71151 RepID=UPI000FF29F79|nr:MULTISPECIES: translation initiation factor IF-2 subunit alpha [unclassified Methanocalculus]MCP1662414.1 translation initiation factor 2 subunit 1 [Methanocalculus sp. AMF5]RQD79503.1 MAG: translation initiation factor IF-2 subunit alpha [Methanocalculus sp. MSAO_Arc1]